MFCREGLPFTDVVEYVTCAIGDSSVEFAVFVVVVSSTHPIGSALFYSSQLQRFAVVVRRVATAMMDHDRMFLRDLVQVVHVELAIVLYLSVIKEVTIDPKPRGRLPGFCAEFIDDAGDGDKLDLVGVADDDFVEENVSARMIMTIDKSGHDGHLFSIVGLCPPADERLRFCCAPHVHESSTLNGKSLRLRHAGIDGVDFGVEYD